MLNLEQVRLLEQRVNKAVAKITALQQENATLREEIGGYQNRVVELEQEIARIKDDQTAIEQGILSALGQLDQLEDEFTENSDSEAQSNQDDDGEVFVGERVGSDHAPGGGEQRQQQEPEDTSAEPAGTEPTAADAGEHTDEHASSASAGSAGKSERESGELEIF